MKGVPNEATIYQTLIITNIFVIPNMNIPQPMKARIVQQSPKYYCQGQMQQT